MDTNVPPQNKLAIPSQGSTGAHGSTARLREPSTTSALSPDRLYTPADLSKITFSTTAELRPIEGLVSQPRALEAIRVGTHFAKPGFNLFVIGPDGARMQVEGKYKRREPTARAKAEHAVRMFREGKRVAHIAKELGIGRASIYRALAQEHVTPREQRRTPVGRNPVRRRHQQRAPR